jgi:hypothetical protein
LESNTGAGIFADATNNEIKIIFFPSSTTEESFSFSGLYLIL